jgi:hypothetical protein
MSAGVGLTLDPTIPNELITRIVTLLIYLQQEDPAKMLMLLPQMRAAASNIQAEIQKHMGPYVICCICSPQVKLKMEDVYLHDTTLHHAYKSR